MDRESAFAAMCKAHDLTYGYADDSRAFIRGQETLRAIVLAAAELPRGVAARIWNDAVDEKIIDHEMRKAFYWMP